MTLTEVTQKLKRYWHFLVLFLAAFLLLGFIFRSQPGKPPAKLPPPSIATYSASTQPQVFDFSKLPEQKFPKTASVYRTTVSKFSKEQAVNMAAKLNFGPNPTQILEQTKTGALYAWIEGGRSLTVSEQTVHFDVSLPETGNPNIKLDIKAAEPVAIGFLQRMGVDIQNLKINPELTRYFKIEKAAIFAATKDAADVVEFNFQAQIEGYPLFGRSSDSGQATVRVDKRNEVVFFAQNQLANFVKADSYRLLDFDTAKSLAEQGRGTIVKAVAKTPEGLLDVRVQPGFNIAKAIISKVFLAYYYPVPIPETTQPIFVFEGDFVDKKRQEGQLTIYLPAIEGQVVSQQ